MAKVDATRSYGGTAGAARARASTRRSPRRRACRGDGRDLRPRRSRTPRVIAGQGTLGLELAEQLPEAETVVIPVGGGGLASGIALALRARAAAASGSSASAAEPDGFDDRRRDRRQAARRADRADPRATARRDRRRRRRGDRRGDRAAARADEARRRGSRRRRPSRRCWPDGSRARAPSRVVLSGGNIDATTLISVMRHGLTRRGPLPRRRAPDPRPARASCSSCSTLVAQRAGERRLASSTTARASTIGVAETEVELTLETRDEEHSRRAPRAPGSRRRLVDAPRDSRRWRPVALRTRERGDARFCARCGAALEAGARGARSARSSPSLFADLVGFTARAEQLDPEDVRAMLAPLPRAARARARAPRRHRREVHRRRGDGGLRRAGRARGRPRARGAGRARDPEAIAR